MMSSSDQSPLDREIYQILGTLRCAEPSASQPAATDEAFAEMNRRILRHLHSSPISAPSTLQRWLFSPRALSVAAALATACVGAFLLSPPRSARTPAPSETATARPVTVTPQTAAARTRPRVAPLRSQPESPAASRYAQHPAPAAPPLDDRDPAFLPSTPAPMAPLTAEEKLLLTMEHRMQHHRRPELVALLDRKGPDLAALRSAPGRDPLFAGFVSEPTQPEDASPTAPLSGTSPTDAASASTAAPQPPSTPN